MPSQKQLEANRRNAQKSTGPTSAAGKAASSMNALKTGLYAKSLIIPGEKAEDLQQLIDEYYRHHRPAAPEQRGVLDDLILCEWELRRLADSLASVQRYNLNEIWDKKSQKHPRGQIVNNSYKAHAALQRRIDSTRRARDRALKLLRDLADRPIAAPEPEPQPLPDPVTPTPPITSHENGFVPSFSVPAPKATPTEAPEPPASESESSPEVVLS